VTRIPRLAAIAYVLALVVIVADLALKHWVQGLLPMPGDSLQVLGPFRLTMVQNKGVSFGVFNSDADWTRWVLSGFSVIVGGVLAVWAWKLDRLVLALALGLIIGGAFGNAINRVNLGWVTDFIDVTRIGFPWVFNLADAAINVGSVLLVWDLFLAPRKRTAV
jgi:signal peptidase II